MARARPCPLALALLLPLLSSASSSVDSEGAVLFDMLELDDPKHLGDREVARREAVLRHFQGLRGSGSGDSTLTAASPASAKAAAMEAPSSVKHGPTCGSTIEYVKEDGKVFKTQTKFYCTTGYVCCKVPLSWGKASTGPAYQSTVKTQFKCYKTCPKWTKKWWFF